MEVFSGLEELEEFNASISGITLGISNDKNNMVNEFIELSMGGFDIDSPKLLESQLENIIENFFDGKDFEVYLNINKITFKTGGADFERWVSNKKRKYRKLQRQD